MPTTRNNTIKLQKAWNKEKRFKDWRGENKRLKFRLSFVLSSAIILKENETNKNTMK